MAVLSSVMDDLILAGGRVHKDFVSNSSVGPFVFVCSVLRLVFALFCVLSRCYEYESIYYTVSSGNDLMLASLPAAGCLLHFLVAPPRCNAWAALDLGQSSDIYSSLVSIL